MLLGRLRVESVSWDTLDASRVARARRPHGPGPRRAVHRPVCRQGQTAARRRRRHRHRRSSDPRSPTTPRTRRPARWATSTWTGERTDALSELEQSYGAETYFDANGDFVFAAEARRRRPDRVDGRRRRRSASWSTPARASTAPASTTACSSRARPQADQPPVVGAGDVRRPRRRRSAGAARSATSRSSPTRRPSPPPPRRRPPPTVLLRLRLKQTRSLELTSRPEPGAGGRRHDRGRVPRRPHRDASHRRRHDRPRAPRRSRS